MVHQISGICYLCNLNYVGSHQCPSLQQAAQGTYGQENHNVTFQQYPSLGGHCCACSGVCGHTGGPTYCAQHGGGIPTYPNAYISNVPNYNALQTPYTQLVSEVSRLAEEVGRLKAELTTLRLGKSAE